MSIKIENVEIFGWDAAIRGMRNPKNSWPKSDTRWVDIDCDLSSGQKAIEYDYADLKMKIIGDNDLRLMSGLARAGSDHSKFLRMINVTADITAPLYWWKEFDTYKVGTVANSCSTMHTIHQKELTLDDFSHEHLTHYAVDGELCRNWLGDLKDLIDDINFARDKFCQTKDKKYWWQMIQLLPSSYNQRRTVQMNYQVLKSMSSRENHKTDEWIAFLEWRNGLPYFAEICLGKEI